MSDEYGAEFFHRSENTMKRDFFAKILLLMAVGMIGWGVWGLLADSSGQAVSGLVAVEAADREATIPAFTVANRVPLKLINRSGGVIRIVGNDAC